MMFFWKKDRRYERRYEVLWDALLDVRFPDFKAQMPVKVTNFSNVGALLQAEQIFLNRRHLIDAHQRPELKLKIFLPEGHLETKINICWYTWSVKNIAFEIGVQFTDMFKEGMTLVDQVINRLNEQHKHIFMS